MQTLKAIMTLMFLLTCYSTSQAHMPQLISMPPMEDEQPVKPQEIRLSRINTEVRIHGWTAETRMTMTFANPTGRNLAGDLYFPLPEGATVSGYALDINGVMVDGVVVEKEKARQVFEKEVRKGVDPGLVEWVKGNNFKTRVFPIPPHGSRTIMVRYISSLSDNRGTPFYHLPLQFSKKVDEFRLRIEVVRGEAMPVISGGIPGLNFGKWRDSYLAETVIRNVAPSANLKVALPELDRHPLVLEKSADGKIWFTINDMPVIPSPQPVAAPERVGIIWDASASRAEASHQRELDALRRFFARFPDKNIVVELTLLRNNAEKPYRFVVKNGDASAVIKTLQSVSYDGGTRMGAIGPEKNPPDYYLLFSDGISNFGAEEPTDLPRPLYIFSDNARTNHPFLRYLAMKSGGAYFNLSNVDPARAAAAAGSPAFSFISASFKSAEISGVTPGIAQPVLGRFSINGQLLTERATITLNYGIGGRITHRVSYNLNAADAARGEMGAVRWGMKRLEELQIMPKRNQREIIETGKRFGLVTEGTSLLVLESLQQYIEHKVEPPASLPQMRAQYHQQMNMRMQEAERKKEDKLQYVLSLWQQRVEWWEKEFTYPPDFKFGTVQGKNGRTMMQESMPPMASVAAPAPSQAPAELRDEAFERRAEVSRPSVKRAKKAKNGGGGSAIGGGAKSEMSEEADQPTATITIKPWNPNTPYIKQLQKVAEDKRYDRYLELRKEYGRSPAFYLDCADFFINHDDQYTALRVLSNIAEMELENPALLRILAHRLEQMNQLDLAAMLFEEVRNMRPEEPQSHRDLALVLARRADSTADRKQKINDYKRSIDLLNHVVMNQWDRFAEIEVITLMELNRIIPKAKQAGIQGIPVDPRLIRPLEVDVRIVLTWDADMTDLDLWVTEPSGEKSYYGHPRTTIGGNMSRDITVGYGPEEYILKKGMEGIYKIETNYYGSRSAELAGDATLQAEVFTNYGKPNEERRTITLRLSKTRQTVMIGEIEFKR